MSTRKLRSDNGTKRKPSPTTREMWRDSFRDMCYADQVFELGYLTAIRDAARETGAPARQVVNGHAAELPLETEERDQ